MNILFRLKKFAKSFSRKVVLIFFLAPHAMLMFLFHYEPTFTCFVHCCLYFHRVLWVQVLVFASKDLSYLAVMPFYILKILNPCQTYATNIFPRLLFRFLCNTIFLYSFLIFKFKKTFPLGRYSLYLIFVLLYLYLFFYIYLSSHWLWFISACGNKVGCNHHFSK